MILSYGGLDIFLGTVGCQFLCEFNLRKCTYVKQMLDGLDPAHKQIVFGGFSEKVPQEERVILIEKFLSSVPSLPLVRNMGVIKTGPKNNKVITRMSYAEYASVDDAREALKILQKVPFTVAATTFTIKAGLTKVNASRNWALKEQQKW